MEGTPGSAARFERSVAAHQIGSGVRREKRTPHRSGTLGRDERVFAVNHRRRNCRVGLRRRIGRCRRRCGSRRLYRKKADEWRNNVANWTFTTNGLHGNKQYYLRITADDNPNDDVQLTFGNGGGTHGERYIVDGGFLELVRMGVMGPQDWTIVETLPEYDACSSRPSPGKGDAWFRYNYDGYGEETTAATSTANGRGRLWPIFTAERGMYEIARSGNGHAGQPYLEASKAFSSPAGFIPEQVWNNSATHYGWQTTTPPVICRARRPVDAAAELGDGRVHQPRRSHERRPQRRAGHR